MLVTVQASCAEVVQSIKTATDQTDAMCLGEAAVTLYYCDDYMVSQHTDADISWAIAMQLLKISSDKDDYDFAFAKWNVYIQTEDGCIWYVLHHI